MCGNHLLKLRRLRFTSSPRVVSTLRRAPARQAILHTAASLCTALNWHQNGRDSYGVPVAEYPPHCRDRSPHPCCQAQAQFTVDWKGFDANPPIIAWIKLLSMATRCTAPGLPVDLHGFSLCQVISEARSSNGWKRSARVHGHASRVVNGGSRGVLANNCGLWLASCG